MANKRIVWDTYCEVYKKNKKNINTKSVIDGVRIGSWISSVRWRSRTNSLSSLQLEKLAKIDFDFQTPVLQNKSENKSDWNRYFFLYTTYKNNPTSHTEKDKVKIASWILRQQKKYSTKKLSKDELKDLKGVGFPLRSKKKLIRNRYINYYKKYGDFLPDRLSNQQQNYSLWCKKQRDSYACDRLRDDAKKELNDIGFEWTQKSETNFERNLSLFEKHGHKIKANTVIDGIGIGWWADSIRRKYKRGKLSKEEIAKFKAINFPFDGLVYRTFLENIEKYKKDKNTPKMKKWASHIRVSRRNESLSDKKIKELDAVSFEWKITPALKPKTASYTKWKKSCIAYKTFTEKTGGIKLKYSDSQDGINLYAWHHYNLKLFNAGKLSKEKICDLENIGFDFLKTRKKLFKKGKVFSALKWKKSCLAYKKLSRRTRERKLRISDIEDGINLYAWHRYTLKLFNAGKLSEKKIGDLKNIGFDFHKTRKKLFK